MPTDHEEIRPHDPLRLLRGTYATSYTGYIYLDPPAANPAGVPQIGAYQPAAVGGFTQVSGYRLHTFAAYLDFDGSGTLHGSGYTNRGGYTPLAHNFVGNYAVNFDLTANAYSGTFTTVEGAFIYTYYWVMSDNWHRLEFMTLSATDHPTVASGTFTRI
ncbi:MAG: hypothetical protein ABI878_06090 [Acidobacteriota bacterium]